MSLRPSSNSAVGAAPCSIKRWRGAAVSPEKCVPQIYLPAREGSLQTEIVAAVRRQGLLALPVEPVLDALLAEIAAGHPVLVLQHLGLSWMPRWHYAVAIGYDPERQQLAPENSAFTRSLKEMEGLTAPSVETCLTLLASPIQSKRLKASAQGNKSGPPRDTLASIRTSARPTSEISGRSAIQILEADAGSSAEAVSC